MKLMDIIIAINRIHSYNFCPTNTKGFIQPITLAVNIIKVFRINDEETTNHEVV